MADGPGRSPSGPRGGCRRRHRCCAKLETLGKEVQAGADAAQRDRTLLDRLVDIRSAKADDPDGSATDADYGAAFREAGVDLSTLAPTEAGAKIKARPPGVALALAAALDDWAVVRRFLLKDIEGAGRPGPKRPACRPRPVAERPSCRTRITSKNRAQGSPQPIGRQREARRRGGHQPEPVGSGLGRRRRAGHGRVDSSPRAKSLCRCDVWIHYDLAEILHRLNHREEAIRFYTAARALRPETAHELAHVLSENGESDETIDIFRDLARLRPNTGRHLACLGVELRRAGRLNEAEPVLERAVESLRQAVRIKPNAFWDFLYLGLAYSGQGKLDEAIADFRASIRLKPDFANSHFHLGRALNDQGKRDEAVAEFRVAIQIKPEDAEFHDQLGHTLDDMGKFDEAAAEFRAAIRLKPDFANAHYNLGVALTDQGKRDDAVPEFRAAIRLKPNFADAHYNLGTCLLGQGMLDEAVDEFRAAIRLKPDYAQAHHNLGSTLLSQGKRDEAADEFRAVIRLKPEDADAYVSLGFVLRARGDYANSLVMYRRVHELRAKQPGWQYPSAQWLAEAERTAALADRLPAMLTNKKVRPNDTAERPGPGSNLLRHQTLQAAAARFWAEAREADPKLGDDRQAKHRYNAACAAALVSTGQGKDDPPPDQAAMTKMRHQALAWLSAELDAWAKVLESGPLTARSAIDALNHWKQDGDLAGVREVNELAKLPEADQKEWQAIWANVEALLNRAQEQAH